MVEDTLGQVVSWYICTVVASLFLISRLWVRWDNMGGLYLDDYLITAAFCCLVGDLAIQQRMWNIGLKNMAAITPEHFVEMMKLIYPGSIFYTLSLWLIKAGLVIFYKRLSGHTYRYLQKLYNATLVWLVISWLVIFFDTIFRCYPLRRTWSQDPKDACPASAGTINYWITITFNISTDVLIICLPISMVMKLKLPLKQKLGVAGVFALGFIVVIASIVRAVYSHRNETMLTCTVSMIETSIAIIATCLPTLRILILGHSSRKGTYASARRSRIFELRDAAPQFSGTNKYSTHRTTITGGAQRDSRRISRQQMGRSDSEDELVKDLHQYPALPSPTMARSPKEASSSEGRISGETYVNSPKPNTIEITTEVTVVPEVTVTVIPEEAHTRDSQRSPSFMSVHEH
ncbi:hypothetical protein MPH_03838 [Macrophomina phaseolina MS6]|uniref:Rhodopsin domain-containing protein n=1 Tax=Macrophomina phaseolina (strain MS6) TaxID=1126212 RepID=K2S1G6_MACPH|nr:hypothetical protein MPH_03838 [Macrophomina phaseolina MS6]